MTTREFESRQKIAAIVAEYRLQKSKSRLQQLGARIRKVINLVDISK